MGSFPGFRCCPLGFTHLAEPEIESGESLGREMEVSLELTSGSNLRESVGNRVGGDPRTRQRG